MLLDRGVQGLEGVGGQGQHDGAARVLPVARRDRAAGGLGGEHEVAVGSGGADEAERRVPAGALGLAQPRAGVSGT